MYVFNKGIKSVVFMNKRLQFRVECILESCICLISYEVKFSASSQRGLIGSQCNFHYMTSKMM